MTVITAMGWSAIGTTLLAAALLDRSLWGEDATIQSLIAACWGLAALVGGIALLARRPFGWWIALLLNILATTYFGYACVAWVVKWLNIGDRALEVDNGLQLLMPAFGVVFLVGAVALLLDRPSIWRRS